MVKHVELGLYTKRITGSRKLISWINCLGHSISYHDINLVKTHIAEEHIANIITPTYVPNNIRPEEFVTYLYDNGDINVESVYGRSYHTTNFQNLLRKQGNESLKQFSAIIMPITNLMDEYDEVLSDPTKMVLLLPSGCL